MPEMADPDQYERCADSLGTVPGVLDADVLDRDPRAQRPLLEVVVGPEYCRVPPRVLRRIADYDLGVRSVQPQGVDGHFTVEVI